MDFRPSTDHSTVERQAYDDLPVHFLIIPFYFSPYDVSAAKDGLKVGDTVTLTIYRDGKTFDVDVKLVDTNDIS